MTAAFTCLVVAKTPQPGLVKTRLGQQVGMAAAADLAAAALLDTLDACVAAVGADRCSVALDGELSEAVRRDEIGDRLRGWMVFPQCGGALGERLAQAHADAPPLPRVQTGMDTPQVTPALLRAVADGLVGHDADLAPAVDGGWWALAIRRASYAAALADVPMSTATTGDDTRAALLDRGLTVATGPVLRDVDTVEDAALVAKEAPWTRFATAWLALPEGSE
jgi:glycosyltransferase A (GT-A) superfamily protein (DUF2064 family)